MNRSPKNGDGEGGGGDGSNGSNGNNGNNGNGNSSTGSGNRNKRTRGPRSCLECRSSKQRCEQINFADIVPSNDPQPLHMACRRCRVLRLACVVPDQLPKSTRLRIERSQHSHSHSHTVPSSSSSKAASSNFASASIAQPVPYSAPPDASLAFDAFTPKHNQHASQGDHTNPFNGTTFQSSVVSKGRESSWPAAQGMPSQQQQQQQQQNYAQAHVPHMPQQQQQHSHLHQSSQSPQQHAAHTSMQSGTAKRDSHQHDTPHFRQPSFPFDHHTTMAINGDGVGGSSSGSNSGTQFSPVQPQQGRFGVQRQLSDSHMASVQPAGQALNPLPSPAASSSAHGRFSSTSRSPSVTGIVGAGHFPVVPDGEHPAPSQPASGHAPMPFEASIFDPMPVLKSVTSDKVSEAAAATAQRQRPSLASSPARASASSLNHAHGHGPVAASALMPPPDESPHSHSHSHSHSQSSGSGAGLELGKEPSWFYRARIAVRPMQLLEHLLMCTPHAATLEQMPPNDATPADVSRRIEEIVRMIAGNGAYMANIERRLLGMQRALPFMPNLQSCRNNFEQSAFLLAVVMYLEGRLPQSETELLHDLLCARCAQYIDNPPVSLFDVCALLCVANFCPLLVKAPSLVGVASGSLLLTSAARAAARMNVSAAPAQLAVHLDRLAVAGGINGSTAAAVLPPLDSAVVQHAFLWMYLTTQELILEIVEVPMPARVRPRHPLLGAQHVSGKDLLANFDIVDNYCRAFVEAETFPSKDGSEDDQTYTRSAKARTSSSTDLARHATMILMAYAARVADIACRTVRSFDTQFEEQVRQIVEMSARVHALRRWTDQGIESLGVNMSSARDDLRKTANYLGVRRLANSTHLKYIELSLGALEFSCMCHLKDKLYVAGHNILGVTGTSQEFLFAIFARPQLLKSYEALGLVRGCVAKHVMMLLGNLALDLSPATKNRHCRPHNNSPQGPLDRWGPLASVIPLSRWCGVIMACVTVLVEELAGRFLAQEAPWGAMGESRLELYTMLTRQMYDLLMPFEDDYAERRLHTEQLLPISVTLDALDKGLTALASWRKRASGIGTYGGEENQVGVERGTPTRDEKSAEKQAGHSSLIEHTVTGGAPKTASSNMPRSASMAPPPSASASTSSMGKFAPAASTALPPGVAVAGAGGDGNGNALEQVHFGDALLHDILFTPIEQFFGATTT